MESQVAGALLEKGILGIIILALSLAIMKLWSKVNEIQEARLAELRESVKAIDQNTNTLDTMTELLRAQQRAGS